MSKKAIYECTIYTNKLTADKPMTCVFITDCVISGFLFYYFNSFMYKNKEKGR